MSDLQKLKQKLSSLGPEDRLHCLQNLEPSEYQKYTFSECEQVNKMILEACDEIDNEEYVTELKEKIKDLDMEAALSLLRDRNIHESYSLNSINEVIRDLFASESDPETE